MPWPEHLIHFLDFEGSLASGVLEYGVVSLVGSQVTAVHTRLCGATGRVHAADAAVHGLDAATVAGAAPLAEDWELFAGLRATGPFAAHFASTENSLLKSVWPYARPSPDFARGAGESAEWGPWIDTGRLCPQFLPATAAAGSAELETLVRALGLQPQLDVLAAAHCPPERRRYHAALYDALAGALLLRALATQPDVAGKSLPWILAMSTLDPTRRAGLVQGELF